VVVQLEDLIRAELQPHIEEITRRLVVELVREQLNGAVEAQRAPSEVTNGSPPTQQSSSRSQGRKSRSTKLRAQPDRACRECGELGTMPGRRICSRCKRKQDVRAAARKQAADDEERPRTGEGDVLVAEEVPPVGSADHAGAS
jgi:hypothetical protein